MPWHSDFADIRDEEHYTDKSEFCRFSYGKVYIEQTR